MSHLATRLLSQVEHWPTRSRVLGVSASLTEGSEFGNFVIYGYFILLQGVPKKNPKKCHGMLVSASAERVTTVTSIPNIK